MTKITREAIMEEIREEAKRWAEQQKQPMTDTDKDEKEMVMAVANNMSTALKGKIVEAMIEEEVAKYRTETFQDPTTEIDEGETLEDEIVQDIIDECRIDGDDRDRIYEILMADGISSKQADRLLTVMEVLDHIDRLDDEFSEMDDDERPEEVDRQLINMGYTMDQISEANDRNFDRDMRDIMNRLG